MSETDDLCRDIKLDALAYQHFTNAETRLTLQIGAIGRRIGDKKPRVKSVKIPKKTPKRPPVMRPRPDPDEIVMLNFIRDTLDDAWQTIHASRLSKQRDLEIAARSLPVWPWVETIRGFGALGLAQMIAETTTLHENGAVSTLLNYSTKAKVWKRMGIGLVAGKIQRRISARGKRGAAKQDAEILATAHGYVPRRRALMHVVGDSLVRGNKKEVDGVSGYYYRLYVARKVIEQGKLPEAAPMVHHKRAMRYMEKQLLKHLWQHWRAEYVHD